MYIYACILPIEVYPNILYNINSGIYHGDTSLWEIFHSYMEMMLGYTSRIWFPHVHDISSIFLYYHLLPIIFENFGIYDGYASIISIPIIWLG